MPLKCCRREAQAAVLGKGGGTQLGAHHQPGWIQTHRRQPGAQALLHPGLVVDHPQHQGRQLVQDLPPAIEQSRCDVCGAVEAGFRGADLALQQRLAGKAGNQQVLRLIPWTKSLFEFIASPSQVDILILPKVECGISAGQSCLHSFNDCVKTLKEGDVFPSLRDFLSVLAVRLGCPSKSSQAIRRSPHPFPWLVVSLEQ